MTLTIRIFILLLALFVLLCAGGKNKDTNGDGIGDLNGIIYRLPYLKDIGVDAILLSPINPSPLKDYGYDISNYREIHPQYGKMADFDQLLAACNKSDIKLILDFVPNHTSNQHEWFQISSNPKHKDYKKYKDYYIWNKGKKLSNGSIVEPSNWRSVFSGSAWTWMKSRNEYYLHQFYSEQPDLNFRNSAVKKEIDETMRFWLQKGVAGFRMDAVGFLMESKANKKGYYDDEPEYISRNPFDDPESHRDPNGHKNLNHTHTKNLDESYELVYHFHDVVKERKFSNFPRILFSEDYTSHIDGTLKYFGNVRKGKIIKNGVEVPFIFNPIQYATRSSSAFFYNKAIVKYCLGHVTRYAKEGKIHPNWVLGNHDRPRLSTRLGEERTDILNILIKTLPGITITYYGEEIGMTDVPIPRKENDEGYSYDRDRCRTPMQWDSTKNAGFSTCQSQKTWLPIGSNYKVLNVELQKSSNRSHLYIFQKLGELRKNPIMKYGAYMLFDGKDYDVLAYKRYIEGESDVVAVFLNFSRYDRIINANKFLKGLPDQMEIYVCSIHSKLKGTVDMHKLYLPRSTGLVLIGKKDVKSKSETSTSSKKKSLFQYKMLEARK
ncbi:probable maltase isoform X2 [Contarinia nasturtii]|uniref:probable maltase isoform X2 n=1 Tax=Contarinia nasturtii TaxID=265458 RepID=UPI0012D4B066|nr:probable maltase isoform X2 [Contarinia nasturtii]